MNFFRLDTKGIGADLQKLRKHLRLTLRQVAAESGVTLSHVWNLEHGAKEMMLDKLFVLCATLGFSADDLIADNIVVDQHKFDELCARQMRDGFQGRDSATIALAANYQSAWCVILCHRLLSPGESKLPGGFGFEFPTPSLQSAFNALDAKLLTEFSLKRRRKFLIQICENPAPVLADFGLLNSSLIEEFGAYTKKRLVNAHNSGSPLEQWRPQPTRIIEFFLAGDDSTGKRGLPEDNIGVLLNEFDLVMAEASLDVKSQKKEKAAPRSVKNPAQIRPKDPSSN